MLNYLLFELCVVFSLILVGRCQTNRTCQIPNQSGLGECKYREKCPAYNKLYEVTSLERLSFIKRLDCKHLVDENLICCPLDGRYANPDIALDKKHKMEPRNRIQFTNDLDCGISGYESKIVGGELAELDDFPWLGLLLYQKRDNDGLNSGCGSALINEQYAVTAAHCVFGEEYNKRGPLKFVRLGEYDLRHDEDCIQEEDELLCTDPPVDVPVESIIVHPEYAPNSISKQNDIALLKLANKVTYSRFIRPICLPEEQYDIQFN